MIGREVKIDFLTKQESIYRKAGCSWALLSVWPAAIPQLGLSHPIMVRLCDWKERWNHWGLLQMSVGSSMFPFWHKKQSMRSIFFMSPPPFLLSLPALRKTPCLQGFLHLPSSVHPKSIHSQMYIISPEAKQQWTCFVSIDDFSPGRTLSHSHLYNFPH